MFHIRRECDLKYTTVKCVFATVFCVVSHLGGYKMLHTQHCYNTIFGVVGLGLLAVWRVITFTVAENYLTGMLYSIDVCEEY